MMSQSQVIDRILQIWVDQFGRAVEMFNGERPVLSSSRCQALPPSNVSSLLWVKQEFVSKDGFAVWIGAGELTWLGLGGSLGGGAPDILRSTYVEMLNQAQQGTVNVLRDELGKAMSCKEAEIIPEPGFDGAEVAIFSLDFGAGTMSLFWAIEVAAGAILGDQEGTLTGTAAPDGPKEIASSSMVNSMVDRLLDLQLPVSVALGRTNLPIKDVLKITSGSVIELTKEVGEAVDLLVHGTVVARGDVVLVKGNYAVRITQVLSRGDRLSLCHNEK